MRAGRRPSVAVLALSLAFGVGTILACVPRASAAPVQQSSVSQRITVKARQIRSSGTVLKTGLKPRILASALLWDYVPGTAVSVPYVALQLGDVPKTGVSVLAARMGKVTPDSSDGFVLRLPLLKRDNSLVFTLIDDRGQFEEWEVLLQLSLKESAIFVDETCKDYYLRIKELQRPAGPNLMYVGCRAGSRPRDLTLDIVWPDIERIQYLQNQIPADSAVLSVPLESRRESDSLLTGIHGLGKRSNYRVHYTPYVPPPYEAWAGLAFFRTAFEQSNFGSKFSSISTAFLGQFWYRPEDVPLSVMVRGFGSLLNFSNTLAPDPGWAESVQTYFLDAELRYRVVDSGGWRIDPFFGGWFFFMKVKSRAFGTQRIIDPVLGLVIQRNISTRDTLGLTIRAVPLQSFFNPFRFRVDQSYIEYELTYIHPFKLRNRLFATLYWGNLHYAPENSAVTSGSYLVLGGGYGW